jgi:hypothetical protein
MLSKKTWTVLMILAIAVGVFVILNYQLPKAKLRVQQDPSGVLPNLKSPKEQAGLPEMVSRTRTNLYRAVQEKNFDRLEIFIDPSKFSYTFGVDEAHNPIIYWQTYGPENIFEIIENLLELPYGIVKAGENTYYSWPLITTLPPEEWTDDMIVEVTPYVSIEEIEEYKKFGSYIGWRLTIDQDGIWRSFIAGD